MLSYLLSPTHSVPGNSTSFLLIVAYCHAHAPYTTLVTLIRSWLTVVSLFGLFNVARLDRRVDKLLSVEARLVRVERSQIGVRSVESRSDFLESISLGFDHILPHESELKNDKRHVNNVVLPSYLSKRNGIDKRGVSAEELVGSIPDEHAFTSHGECLDFGGVRPKDRVGGVKNTEVDPNESDTCYGGLVVDASRHVASGFSLFKDSSGYAHADQRSQQTRPNEEQDGLTSDPHTNENSGDLTSPGKHAESGVDTGDGGGIGNADHGEHNRVIVIDDRG